MDVNQNKIVPTPTFGGHLPNINSTRAHARVYQDMGWVSLQYQHRTKKPVFQEWQKKKLANVKIDRDFHSTLTNIGILLGEPSGGLVDVDLDCSEAVVLAPRFLPATSTRFGRASKPLSHWLYYADVPATKQFPDPTEPSTDKKEKGMLVELRSTGGQTMFPPSVHPSGELVQWSTTTLDPSKVDAAELEDKVRCLAFASFLLRHWKEGKRNELGLCAAGAMLSAGWQDTKAQWLLDQVMEQAHDPENRTCVESTRKRMDANEPFKGLPKLAEALGANEKKLRSLIGGTGTYLENASTKDKPTSADILMAELSKVELWQDERGIPHATVPTGDHFENIAISSVVFRLWLSRAFYLKQNKMPPKEAVSSVIDFAFGKARFEGKKYQTWIRVARLGDKLYLDLGDDTWKAIEISPGSWRVVDNPPVRFQRSGTTKSLPLPERGGSIESLNKLINLADKKTGLILVTGWLVSCLRPNTPIPIGYIIGEFGSAKTTVLGILIDLIDPRIPKNPGLPEKEGDLLVSAQNRWIIPADNVSHITPDMADALCRLATGGGLEKRKLYSDEENHAIDVKRPVILNGLQVGTERADFLDRTILIPLEVLDEKNRMTDDEVQKTMRTLLPQILGKLLDGAATALLNLEKTKVALKGKLPRMADFAAWCEAAGPAFGWKENEFLTVYQDSISNRLTEAAKSDRLVCLIAEWIKNCGGTFKGEAQELHSALENYYREIATDVVFQNRSEEKWWPKTAVWLGRTLPTKRRVLLAFHVVYERHESTGTNPATHSIKCGGVVVTGNSKNSNPLIVKGEILNKEKDIKKLETESGNNGDFNIFTIDPSIFIGENPGTASHLPNCPPETCKKPIQPVNDQLHEETPDYSNDHDLNDYSHFL